MRSVTIPNMVSGRQELELRFPEGAELDQNEEWFEACLGGDWQRFRIHDYDRVYNVPGLYESVVYQALQCVSPVRVVSMLKDVMAEFAVPTETLRVLDLGAGNGMVGYELQNIGASAVVGADIIPEAATSTERDRPWCYTDYVIADLTAPSQEVVDRVRGHKLNALTCVAALGFGDIPARAFLNAIDLIEPTGWVAFNIKEAFMEDRDTSGFADLIRALQHEGVLQTQAYRRYQHRVSIAGEALYYGAIIATKNKAVPDSIKQSF